jgi:hypothetical protein
MKSSGTRFFLFLLVYQFAFYGVLGLVRGRISDVFIESPWFLILLQLIALLLPLVIWLAIKKENINVHMPNMKLGRVNTLFIIGISFFMLPMMALISALSTFLAPNVASDAMGQMESYSLWVLLLAVAVTPAVVEEVVFRGYIQSQYKSWVFWKVALLNGFFFGLIHFNIQQFFYAFAMGVVMAYFVYYTRSIRAGIISHFFVNAFNIVLFRFSTWYLDWAEEFLHEAGDTEVLSNLQDAVEVSPWAAVLTVGIVALAFSPFAVILFKAFISHNRQRFAVYDIKQALVENEDEA